MSASELAKRLGCNSLEQVSAFSGYTLPTLHRYYKEKPKRFKGLCLAAVCDELGVDGNQLRQLHKVCEMIRGVS